MKIHSLHLFQPLFAILLASSPLAAQGDMRGHWTGALETPAGPMAMEFDLDKPAAGPGAGNWIGSMTIPSQGASGIPLEAVSFANGQGTFQIKGVPGAPSYAGTLSADGKTIDGNFSQGPMKLPLKLTRTGNASVAVVKASPAVAKQFVGTWNGTLAVGPGLRVSLNLTNGASGAEATMVSIDQGNSQIAVTSIAQTGTNLKLDLRLVGGTWDAQINSEGSELSGPFTQMGNTTVLTLKKVAPAAK